MSTLHAWLEFTDVHTGSLRRVDMDTTTLSIGKTGGDLRLQDDAASEIHAIISRERDVFIVRDLGSQAGTYVNGRPVVEAQLANLDEVLVGKTKLIFHAAYLTPEVAASRLRKVGTRVDFVAPGHLANTPSRRTLIPFAMFFHPLRFWPQALETGVFQLRRTWMTHFLGCSALLGGALLNGGGVPLLHLGFLLLASTIALVLMAITCSVFFAFESMPDAPHRLSQSMRFTFFLAPFLLLIQICFIAWASRAHPKPAIYFIVATVPTMVYWAYVGMQAHFAFAATFGRALAFAVTASVPWNLFMTGLMALMV